MTDEKYEFLQDCKEKKITARSARNVRTHCGRRGAVKFPSDYMSEKEKQAMNGECIKYASLKKPMPWIEFKKLPQDLAVQYVKSLRKKYNVPNNALAEMFGVDPAAVSVYFKTVGLSVGYSAGGKRVWDKEGFTAWCGEANDDVICHGDISAESTDEIVVVNEEAEIDIPETEENNNPVTYIDEFGQVYYEAPGPAICTNTYHQLPVIPKNGSMTFEHNYADDALATIKSLLSNVKVNLTIYWECVNE